ncbi:MAG: flagellar hook-associated protein 3 [Spirochaetales bacterium]|nr:flagellar hook-associated protein 3 [Spirochaetales bacterium]
MKRVSTNLGNNDMQYYMRLREYRMNETQNKMASQSRILNLRDDPVSASHATRYKSNVFRMNRYVDNINTLTDKYHEAEGYVKTVNDILISVRELAVQGANDVYTPEDRHKMAIQVDQLLNEMVKIANQKSGDGSSLFSGARFFDNAFQVLEGNIDGAAGKVITRVMYNGNIQKNMVEIAENNAVAENFPGNNIFWAEQQQVFSSRNALAYVVPADSSVFIDGQEISLSQGDNVQAIIARINKAGLPVKANLDPVRNSLVISSTSPHQLWMEDRNGSSVLSDLGILKGDAKPPFNYASDARISGGSLFDMVIRLRDELYSGNSVEIGGAALKGIDKAHDSLLAGLADLGSKSERLEHTMLRYNRGITDMVQRDSRETDIDLAEAITNLKMLEYSHKTALQTAARILKPTLLDYLR